MLIKILILIMAYPGLSWASNDLSAGKKKFISANTKLVTPNIVLTLKPVSDKKGGLITPDKIMLAEAISQYQDGYNQLAMVYFKRSAAFGNANAQTQIGLMHLKSLGVKEDWATGYAWIRLAAQDNTLQHAKLKQKVFDLLTPEEKERSEAEYQKIIHYFSRNKAYTRRVRWVRKVTNSVLGSRVGSRTSNVQSVNLDGSVRSIYSDKKINAYDAFIKEFNYGIVESGEIKAVDKSDENP